MVERESEDTQGLTWGVGGQWKHALLSLHSIIPLPVVGTCIASVMRMKYFKKENTAGKKMILKESLEDPTGNPREPVS